MVEFDPIAFNLENPERHLLDYLPPFLQQVQEFQAVNAANEPEIRLAWQALGRVLGNQFLAEADGGGLAVWERELGIWAKDTDSLSLRRARIKAAWQRQPPYTLRWLRGWLDSICGEGNYTLNVQDYTLNIQLEHERLAEPSALLREILSILQPLKPANMLLRPAMLANSTFAELFNQRLLLRALKMPLRIVNNTREIIRLNSERRLDGCWKLDQDIRSLIFQRLLLELAAPEQERLSAAGGIRLQSRGQTAEALHWPQLEFGLRIGNLAFARLNGERRLDGRWFLEQLAGGTKLSSLEIQSGWQLENQALAAGSLHLPKLKLINANQAACLRLHFNIRLGNQNVAGQPQLKLQSGWQEQNRVVVGTLTRDTMWRLGGEALLDGNKKINAAIIKESI